MTLEKVIWDRLIADDALSAIVGNRIYEDVNDLPDDFGGEFVGAVSFQLESESSEEAIDDALTWESLYSFVCMATDSERKTAIGVAVKASLAGLLGEFEGLVVHQTSQSNMRDEPVQDTPLRIRTVYWTFVWRLA